MELRRRPLEHVLRADAWSDRVCGLVVTARTADAMATCHQRLAVSMRPLEHVL